MFDSLKVVLGVAAFPFYLSAIQKKGLTEMTKEEIYDEAYKDATGSGERHKGAHMRGLQAVYDAALYRAKVQPLRFRAYKLLQTVEGWVKP